jgi:hypothetical protein
MNQINYFLFICLISAATGCSVFKHQNVVLAPVGPVPLTNSSGAPEGQVVVFSAWESGTPGESDNVYYHSGYKIYTHDGKMLNYVDNKIGAHIEDPAVVNLPLGRYTVIAKATAFGNVSVPVVVEAGRTTFVHLNGSEFTAGKPTSASDAVHLPDGSIVGWRAKSDEERR